MKGKLIGVISDTHGLLRPEVAEAFKGADLILHAGDIGSLDVIESLQSVARVIAIRGNNDTGKWARAFNETETVSIDGVKIFMLHDVKQLPAAATSGKFQVVISGHSHKPLIGRRDGVLFVNPGSAGPRRFKLPTTVARLNIDRSIVDSEIVELLR
jgi:uncharacterized protein